jgi:hypothetical protein
MFLKSTNVNQLTVMNVAKYGAKDLALVYEVWTQMGLDQQSYG